MDTVRENQIPVDDSPAGEVLRAVRSEPALAWFLAQALWIAQPALEIFWPPEKLTAAADLLESRQDSGEEDGKRTR